MSVPKQKSLNLKSGIATLANLRDGATAGTITAMTRGTAYYVDAANGSNSNSGLSPEAAVADIATAYGKCTAGQHDAVYYIASGSSVTLSAALDWAKDYTHLFGICAPTSTAQRARIFQLSTLTGASPLLTISASGCIFSNFYIFQGVDDATSLINVSVTGGRNYFENVHFAGGGHATQAINGGASLLLNGAEENTFVDCTIGVDTIDAATGMVGILFDGEAHRNTFENCTIRIRAGNAGAAFVEVADATGIDRDTQFNNCRFLNNSATALTSAFVIPAGMGAPRKILLDSRCMVLGSTKLDANDRDVLFGNLNAVTGADLSGVAVELVT
jgi:hypothetical protein